MSWWSSSGCWLEKCQRRETHGWARQPCSCFVQAGISAVLKSSDKQAQEMFSKETLWIEEKEGHRRMSSRMSHPSGPLSSTWP